MRFAAVRRRRRIAEPCGNGGRFACLQVIKCATAPAPIVAIAQRRLDVRIQSKCFGGLPRSQFGCCPATSGAGQAPGERLGFYPAAHAKRFVGWKGSLVRGVGRRVANKDEARSQELASRDRRSARTRQGIYALRKAVARWVSAPNRRPSVVHMMICAASEATRNFHNTTAGNSSGTSLTVGSRSPATIITTT
jgi:hypothetical protein